MRYRFATLSALVLLTSSAIIGQNFSITNYQLVDLQAINESLSSASYSADLMNPGGALASVTATLSIGFNFREVPGENTLSFAPVPADSQVASSNTFTILFNPAVPVDLSSLQWTFQSVAGAPVANAGPNQTVNVGATVTLNGSGSTNPSGIGTLSYSWQFTSIPTGSKAVLSNSTSVMPTFVADLPGTYVIQLTVSNGVASSTASVTVTTSNTAPVANAGPNQTVAVGSTVTLNGSGSSDVNGNPLTYSWTLVSIPAGSAAVLKGANTVSPTFVADVNGEYVAQLIVNDGVTNSQPSMVTISTMGSAPTANAGPDQVVRVGSVVQLNGAGSTDLNGNPLTYQWSLLSVPTGSTATLANATIVDPTFIADVSGIYVAQLIVNDEVQNSAPATVTISTNAILPPVANAGPNQSATLNMPVVLQGSGSDPQGLPLTYQWSLISKPTGSAAVLSSTTVPDPSFTPDVGGTYVAQLIVSNGFQSSFASTVTITTTSNTAPVANAGPNQLVTVGATVTLNGTGSTDSNGAPLSYSWSLLTKPAGSAAALSGSNTAHPTFVADVGGVYVAQLIVSDGVAVSTPATVTITTQSLTLTPNPLNVANNPGTMTVTLSAPAGPDGQVVNLAVENTSIATTPVSVTVPPGSSSMTFSVTPLAIGSTEVLASASGFFNALATVNVTSVSAPPPPSFTIQFSPTSLTITGTATQNLTLLLSAAAPSGGLTINVSSSNPAAATVPATVTFAAGATSVIVPVTGVAAGAATINASALPNIANTTASVTVTSPPTGIILPANTSLGVGSTASFSVSLAQPAPSGGLFISLMSSDTTTLTIRPTSILIPEGSTTPTITPTIFGVAAGSASITASAFGFTSVTAPVQVTQ